MPKVADPPRSAPEHRLAVTPRAKTKDSVVALDMFSGCGGSSEGIEAAGIDVWYAANHWEYAVDVHEANHPKAEHFIADLLNEDRPDYYHPEALPRADVLWASPSCTNNSKANAQRIYERNLSLFHDLDDPDYEDRVTTSERSRATAVSVLQYARKHRPKVVVVENVVEFAQWGMQVPGTKRGDGTTFHWWLDEFVKLGYRYKTLMLNSMFFPPTPQSRDRMYVVFWDRDLRAPDLAHRPEAWCDRCSGVVESVQAFKQRTAAWPIPEWGKYEEQYVYRCPSCADRVYPVAWPALTAIDWSDLGTRIGDRDRPLKATTLARIERGIAKFREWPPLLIPAKAQFGVDRQVTQPMTTQTTQQAMMIVHGMQVVAAGNTFEHPGSSCRTRGMHEPMWSQHTTPAFAMVTAPGFTIKNNGSIDEAQYRAQPITDPLGALVASQIGIPGVVCMPWLDNWQGVARSLAEVLPTQAGGETMGLVTPMLFTNRGTKGIPQIVPVTETMSTVSAGGNHFWLVSPPGCVPIFAKQNGGPADTAWHEVTERLNTLCSTDTTCLVSPGHEMPPIDVNDCFYRMLAPGEIKTGMGIRPDFKMHGTNRMQVKALGNAVTPPVATWLMDRATAVLR